MLHLMPLPLQLYFHLDFFLEYMLDHSLDIHWYRSMGSRSKVYGYRTEKGIGFSLKPMPFLYHLARYPLDFLMP